MSRKNGLRIGQRVSHAYAGQAEVLETATGFPGYVLVKLADGSEEYWKVRQTRVKIGVAI